MNGFKEFFKQIESSPATRHAMGIYPPSPDDAFAKPGYSQSAFCSKMADKKFKPVNMDTTSVCGKRKK